MIYLILEKMEASLDGTPHDTRETWTCQLSSNVAQMTLIHVR